MVNIDIVGKFPTGSLDFKDCLARAIENIFKSVNIAVIHESISEGESDREKERDIAKQHSEGLCFQYNGAKAVRWEQPFEIFITAQ